METHILIKIRNAAKSGQTEEFSATKHHELIIGRDPACELRFDAESDLVSRRHAKITQASGDSHEYTVADLGSRNGTFVNHQRIFSAVALNCGDIVQLGPGGPEFEFDLEPRPAELVKATRLADSVVVSSGSPLPPTRESAPVPASGGGIGKATVERMIGETKRQSNRILYAVAGSLLLVVAALATWFYFARSKPTVVVQKIEQKLSPTGLTPTQITQNNTDATVEFEVGWKLVDMESGKQLFHVVVPNRQAAKDKEGKPVKGKDGKPQEEEIVQGAGDYLPAFMILENRLEPVLTTDEGGGKNFPIGGRHFGSGFVVSNDGFILTNRHVAAAWHSSYGFSNEQVRAGLVLIPGEREMQKKPIPVQQFPGYWVPAQAKLVVEAGSLQQIQPNVLKGKALEGRNDYLDVAFAKNRIRIPAKLSRISDRMDVAMVKIDLPQTLKKVELNDNWETVKVGDPVVILGYPQVSSMVPVIDVAASRDILNQQVIQKEVADPTLSSGNISRIVRGQVTASEGAHFGGDFYQLTINSTGHGNSGGPMFDDQGRVIGIFTLGWTDQQGATVTGSIPIRYGMELMGVHPAQN
ncbi:trypsin-like peptidase domain-containing protein [uncultured Paludibaculum sp.]|uniref:trypsin-like peptidase domain-containing protein n=1 Tax=uncultured Paludibaculum sp. TaxID=1765020 RepID=UPI002AABC019|nr:trypsin-like peptidase domain-containing protein [uncultured Paludibaculum sp.]